MPPGLQGADVSQVQGALTPAQWQEWKANGLAFAIDKAAGGITGIDARWATNSAGCRAGGIPFGAYCAFVPGDDAEAQARAWFAASGGCGRKSGELPPVIDFEEASSAITAEQEIGALVVVIATMTTLWGRAPILYTYPDFWTRIFANATDEERAVIATCLLWFAAYASAPPAPPAPWTKISFWQACGGTNGFRTPGGAPCDEDYFLGTDAELAALTSFDADQAPAAEAC